MATGTCARDKLARKQLKASNDRIQEVTERGLEPISAEQKQKNLELAVDVAKLGGQMVPQTRLGVTVVDVATIAYEAWWGDTMKSVNTAGGVAAEMCASAVTRGGSVALETKAQVTALYGFVVGKVFEQSIVPSSPRPACVEGVSCR